MGVLTRGTRGSTVGKLALSAAAGAAALLAGEAGLRLAGMRPFPEGYPRGLHRADPELGIVPVENFRGVQTGDSFAVTIETNSLGLRSPEWQAGLPTLLLLGDSFAFGHGVEQDATVAARLADALPGWQVQDAGVMSYGVVQSEGRFERLAPALHPRITLLLVFAGNDVLDDQRALLTVDHGRVVGPGERITALRSVKLFFKHHSVVYRALAGLLHSVEIPGECTDHPAFGFDLVRVAPTPEVSAGWEATEGALARLSGAARTAGTRLAVLLLPTRYQVDDAWWRRHVERCGFREGDFDLSTVSRRLAAACERLGLPFLDLEPSLRAAAAAGSPLFFDAQLLEVHLNPLGHAVVAEAARVFLEREGWLGTDSR